MFNRTNKFIQVWTNMRASSLYNRIYIFGWRIPKRLSFTSFCIHLLRVTLTATKSLSWDFCSGNTPAQPINNRERSAQFPLLIETSQEVVTIVAAFLRGFAFALAQLEVLNHCQTPRHEQQNIKHRRTISLPSTGLPEAKSCSFNAPFHKTQQHNLPNRRLPALPPSALISDPLHRRRMRSSTINTLRKPGPPRTCAPLC